MKLQPGELPVDQLVDRERERVRDVRDDLSGWRKWGPYLAERQWGTREITTLTSFAQLTSIALDNARLVDEAQRGAYSRSPGLWTPRSTGVRPKRSSSSLRNENAVPPLLFCTLPKSSE